MTLADRILEIAGQHADRTAVVDGRGNTTYGALLGHFSALASELRRRGVTPGDRVGLLLPNSLDFAVGYFGALFAGAILVPLNDQYREREIRYFLDRCGVRVLITRRDYEPLCRRVLGADDRVELLPMDERLDRTPPSHGALSAPPARPEDPVMFQFSSGSTGPPKRIARSHANLLFEIESLVATLGIRPEDRFLGAAPFSHVNGLMRTLMASLYGGASVYPLSRFDRREAARVIEESRITIFIAVPFMFGMLAKTAFRPPPDFSSLRLCVSASAPMPVGVNREFFDRFGLYVRQLYGSTETGTISVNLSPDVAESLDSVGLPIRGVEVVVLSEDGSRVSPGGGVGEVAVRSPGAIARYEDAEVGGPDNEVFRDGLFLTGDLGRIDAQGRLYLIGRKKFFINKGGYKINPQEVEQLLESHPLVEEAAVVGVPTQFEDEKVKAVVVTRGEVGPEDLVAFCRGKIADFKLPSLVEVRESLPKTSTGKIRKKMLI
jgi:long-chain acyl-CoA synthetase